MGSGIFKLLIGLIILIVSLASVFLIGTATAQWINEFRNLRSHKKRDKRKRKESRKRYKREQKAAPEKFDILMQDQNKFLFENFVKLLDKVNWPEYPNDFIDEDGVKHLPSMDEIDDYEDELDDAIEEETKMYKLYLTYLESKNIFISNSEMIHVIELYKKKMKIVRR